MPRVRISGKAKGNKAEPEYEPVIPRLTADATGVIFERVCWVRCSPKWALYMINGKGYGIPHSQIHEDSEVYYIAADFDMSVRPKRPCTLVAKTWIIAQKQDEHKELLTMLEDAGIFLNEYGKQVDTDCPGYFYDDDNEFRYDDY